MAMKYSEADTEAAVRQITGWLKASGKGRSKAALARIAGISPAAVRRSSRAAIRPTPRRIWRR